MAVRWYWLRIGTTRSQTARKISLKFSSHLASLTSPHRLNSFYSEAWRGVARNLHAGVPEVV